MSESKLVLWSALHQSPTPIWSPLIGRDQDIQRIERYLQEQRLLTLWGPGGSGKTRLAQEAARRMHELFADGARFITCSDLQEPGLLLRHVATGLGLQVTNERNVLDLIIGHVRSRRLLLVLDNCEHLLDACTQLVELILATCPLVHILVTSRELLHLPGEQVYPVQPLAIPPPEVISSLFSSSLSPVRHREESNAEVAEATNEQTEGESIEQHKAQEDVERIGSYSAVHLFVQRAQMVQPGFALSHENAALVATICRLTDGLPLAIELAAARVRMLALEQIAERLAEGIALLGNGNRLAPARQQTLEATIRWSFQLLSLPEQRLLCRLALVAGGFDLSLVEAIGKGVASDVEATVNLLGQLIDKSLVAVVTLDGNARYRLLDTIRHFGREQLQQLGETEATYRQYGEWVRQLSERAEYEIEGSHQITWLNRLDAEIEHIRSVIGWLLQCPWPGALAEVVRISTALTWWYEQRAHLREATQWLEAALAILAERAEGIEKAEEQQIEPALEAKAFLTLGILNLRRHQADQISDYLAQAQDYLTRAQQRYTQLKDDAGIASSLSYLGALHYWRADYRAAQTCLERGLAIAPKEAPGLRAWLYQRLAATLCQEGDRQQARFYNDKCLVLHRQAANIGGLALALANLGDFLTKQGDYTQAQHCLMESLQYYEELGDRDGYLLALVNLCEVAVACGDATLILDYLAVALASPWAECKLWLLAELFDLLARLALLYQRPLEATQLFGSAAALKNERSDLLPPPILEQLRQRLPAQSAQTERMQNALLSSYTAAWAKGQLMGMEEAFAFALHTTQQFVNEQPASDRATIEIMGKDVFPASLSSSANVANASTNTTADDARSSEFALSTVRPLRIEAFRGGIVSYGDAETDAASEDGQDGQDGRDNLMWHNAKARELFFYLLNFPYRTKGQICLALWPDAADEQASTYMRVTFHRLRKTLRDARWVHFTPAGYAFDRSLPYWYDVEQFEKFITQARTLPHTPDVSNVPDIDEAIVALLAKACALYQGDYLADLPPQDWIIQRQAELQRHYIDAHYLLARAYQRLREPAQALACYQRVAALDPYDERAHAAIVRCYTQLGQRSKAIRYYHQVQHYLHDELGVTPDPRLTALIKQLLASA